MKKFLIISAAVLFAALAALSITFGVLYSKEKDKNKPSNNMSMSDANNLTTMVCLNLGLTKPATGTSVKAQALPNDENRAYYQDATAAQLKETTQHAVADFVEGILLANAITKTTISQDTYYVDTFKHGTDYIVYYTYNINGQTLILNAIVANDADHKAYQTNIEIAYTNSSKNSWSVEGSIFNPYTQWTYQEKYNEPYLGNPGCAKYFKATGTDSGVSEVEYIEFKAVADNFTDPTQDVVRDSSISDVVAYYANFNTMKRYELTKSASQILQTEEYPDAINLAKTTHERIKALQDNHKLATFVGMKESSTLGSVLTADLKAYEEA